MKSILLLFMISTILTANPNDYSKDVESLDSIIEALYDVISGEKWEARDWEWLFRKGDRQTDGIIPPYHPRVLNLQQPEFRQ